jgi:hypothetical protein
LSYPKSRIIPCNLCKDLSLNTQKNQASKSSIKSKEHPSSEKIFQIVILVWSSLPLPLSWFLIPTFPYNPIRNDRKHPLFFQIATLVPFSNKIFFRLQKLNMFPDFRWNFALCCLALAIAVALLIGARCANIHRKPEKDVYKFGIQSFLRFHFDSSSKFWNSQFPPICPMQNSSSISSTLIKHISWTIDRMRACQYPLERRGSPLHLLYSTVGPNPTTIVLISYFLTAAHSQDIFDVSTRSVISRCCW